MKRESIRWALVLAVFVQGCAMEAGDPEHSTPNEPAPGEPAPPSQVLSASCERLDELGLAAQGLRLSSAHLDAVEAPCVMLDRDRIARLGSRSCALVAPQGFSLSGCLDSYDCDGCPVEVRHHDELGFVVSGLSTATECADLAAKYALVAAPVCQADEPHL